MDIAHWSTRGLALRLINRLPTSENRETHTRTSGMIETRIETASGTAATLVWMIDRVGHAQHLWAVGAHRGRMSGPWLMFREVCMLDVPRNRLTLDRMRTPLGQALLVTDADHRLRALDWEEYAPRMKELLRLHYGSSPALDTGRAPHGVRAALDAYFAGSLEQLHGIECHLGGTPFQRAVWTALRAIPPGRTMSYGALAAALGAPKAVRAVGRANGANPICVVVPCHRVIGADGSLTGYGGGLERKRWLLAHEGASFTDRVGLFASL
jgi:methylated-DNA-[protein]-cysteine S-methyltransferase